MTWEVALQTFTAGLATISIYFIWDLIREYKLFKKETSTDLVSLRAERRNFEVMTMSFSIKIDELRNTTDNSIKIINHEITKFGTMMTQLNNKAKGAENYMRKGLELAQGFDQKIKASEQEIKYLKIQMGELTIFKAGK